jgi:RNA polymerase sigma factor (sigma-70 family)
VALDSEQRKRFDEMYREHAQMVFRTSLRFAAGERQWALDRMQDVFVKLARNIDTVQENPGGWLYRVAVNECFMAMRRQKTWGRVKDTLFADEPIMARSPEPDVEAREALGRLSHELEQLPAKQRAVMVLVYLEGRSQNEAANLLDLSKGQVSKLHKRALDTLRQREWDVA